MSENSPSRRNSLPVYINSFKALVGWASGNPDLCLAHQLIRPNVRPTVHHVHTKLMALLCQNWWDISNAWLLSCHNQHALDILRTVTAFVVVYSLSLCSSCSFHHVHDMCRSRCKQIMWDVTWIYSGPCILRPPLQPDKYGLKLEVVLK